MAFVGSPASGTLAPRVVPRQGIFANKAVHDLVLMVAGSLFVALLAQIRIPLPFTPVPITGQTLGVLLVGSLLGTRLGLFSMLLYLAMGAVGLPFFAGGNSGIAYMQGPTLGYLVSYPIVAALMGWLAERGWDRRVPTTIFAMVIGNIIIYALGVGWLAILRGNLVEAFMLGALPFLIGDGIKILIAAGVLPGAWKLLGSAKKRG